LGNSVIDAIFSQNQIIIFSQLGYKDYRTFHSCVMTISMLCAIASVSGHCDLQIVHRDVFWYIK